MKGNLLDMAGHRTKRKTKAYSYVIGRSLEIGMRQREREEARENKQQIHLNKVRDTSAYNELQGFQNASPCFLLLMYYII